MEVDLIVDEVTSVQITKKEETPPSVVMLFLYPFEHLSLLVNFFALVLISQADLLGDFHLLHLHTSSQLSGPSS